MQHQLTRRSFLAGLGIAPAAAAVGHIDWLSQQPSHRVSLTGTAEIFGRFFGAAVQINQIQSDEKLHEAVLRDCTYLTPEIHLKWDAVEPRQGAYSFSYMDRLVSFASSHKFKIRGHTLLWDESTPRWAKERLVETQDWRLVRKHISKVMSRYGHAIEEWDVINEPIDANGKDGLRENVFLRTFGPAYVANALRDARSIAPQAKLFINDYGFEYDNPFEERRRQSFLKLLRRIVSECAPLDGVGLQAHLGLGRGKIEPSVLHSFLQKIADLGLEIVITELDVKETDFSAPVEERDQWVADEARGFLDIALEQSAMKGVVAWGLSDRHSWLSPGNSTGAGTTSATIRDKSMLNRGLPYDADFRPKLLYWTLHDALARRRSLSGINLNRGARRSAA